jgi:hypothetical protein
MKKLVSMPIRKSIMLTEQELQETILNNHWNNPATTFKKPSIHQKNLVIYIFKAIPIPLHSMRKTEVHHKSSNSCQMKVMSKLKLNLVSDSCHKSSLKKKLEDQQNNLMFNTMMLSPPLDQVILSDGQTLDLSMRTSTTTMNLDKTNTFSVTKTTI